MAGGSFGEDGVSSGDPRPSTEVLAARSEEPQASQNPMAMVQAVPEEPMAGVPTPATAFADFYRANYTTLVRLAFVLTSSLEVAEDLVQDCFVRVHRHYDRLDTPDRYLKQAVVNACRSHFRKLGRERDRRPLLYVIDGEGNGAIGGELHDVLLQLPYRQRAAVVLRYYADLSELEIAEVLGCRPGTVGSLVHRALERMRGVLEQ